MTYNICTQKNTVFIHVFKSLNLSHLPCIKGGGGLYNALEQQTKIKQKNLRL